MGEEAKDTTGSPDTLDVIVQAVEQKAVENRAVASTTGEQGPVAGLGVDIVDIERMKRAIERSPHLPERIFTQEERDYCEGKSHPETHYALRFAAKEAVLKALGTGFSGMKFTDVEVTHDRYGRPVPLLRGHAAEIAQQRGVIEMHLSLSYTHTVGVASAVAVTEENRPHKDERVDPRLELAQQFKEMRAMLDDMDGKLKEIEGENDVTGEKGAMGENGSYAD